MPPKRWPDADSYALGMAKFADSPVVEVATSVPAPPSVVWALVTDIELPARFQGEFQGAEWLDDGPALGARFKGRNARGERTWETTSWVVSYEPERSFGWAVSDPDKPGATWTFRLEAEEHGTLLTFHRTLGPGPSGILRMIEAEPEREAEIIALRDETHRSNMQAVVDGIAELAGRGAEPE